MNLLRPINFLVIIFALTFLANTTFASITNIRKFEFTCSDKKTYDVAIFYSGWSPDTGKWVLKALCSEGTLTKNYYGIWSMDQAYDFEDLAACIEEETPEIVSCYSEFTYLNGTVGDGEFTEVIHANEENIKKSSPITEGMDDDIDKAEAPGQVIILSSPEGGCFPGVGEEPKDNSPKAPTEKVCDLDALLQTPPKKETKLQSFYGAVVRPYFDSNRMIYALCNQDLEKSCDDFTVVMVDRNGNEVKKQLKFNTKKEKRQMKRRLAKLNHEYRKGVHDLFEGDKNLNYPTTVWQNNLKLKPAFKRLFNHHKRGKRIEISHRNFYVLGVVLGLNDDILKINSEVEAEVEAEVDSKL